MTKLRPTAPKFVSRKMSVIEAESLVECADKSDRLDNTGSRVSDLNPSVAVIVCGTIFLVCLITQPTLRTRVTSSGAGYTNSLLISYFCLDFTNFCTVKYPIELIGDICTVRTVGHEDRKH